MVTCLFATTKSGGSKKNDVELNSLLSSFFHCTHRVQRGTRGSPSYRELPPAAGTRGQKDAQ